jgi:hypothetical protein
MQDALAWQDIGVTHLSVATRGSGLAFPDGHLDLIRRFMDAAKAAGVV